MIEFKDRLKELMKEYNLSPEKLEDNLKKFSKDTKKDCNISRNTIRNYLKGNTPPKSFERIEDLARYFNVSTDYIQGLTDEPSTDVKVKEIYAKYGLTEENLKHLETYKKDKLLSITIKTILNDETFIKNLSAYLINSNLTKYLDKNEKMASAFRFTIPFPSELDNSKYTFYDILESLINLNKSIGENIHSIVKKNPDLLFEYVNYITEKSISDVPLEELGKSIQMSDQEEKEAMKDYYNSEQYKIDEKFKNEYNKFIKTKQECEKNECKGTRKK